MHRQRCYRTMPTPLTDPPAPCPWCAFIHLAGLPARWRGLPPCRDGWHFLGWYPETLIPALREARAQTEAPLRIGERVGPAYSPAIGQVDVWVAWEHTDLSAFWQAVRRLNAHESHIHWSLMHYATTR